MCFPSRAATVVRTCTAAATEALIQVSIALQALLLESEQFVGLFLHFTVKAHDFLLQLLNLVEQITQVLSRRRSCQSRRRFAAVGAGAMPAGAPVRC